MTFMLSGCQVKTHNMNAMLQVLHISAECYPAAKTGGLGDVVGSLPKYMTRAGVLTGAILPKYGTSWIRGREWITVFSGAVRVHDWHCPFQIQQEKGDTLGYPLFVVDAPDLFSSQEIYGVGDEVERALVFQQAVIKWIQSFPEKPKVLHCHDHHTALIPWMINHCPEYSDLHWMPTVFTIHNGQYQGAFSWSHNGKKLPYFNQSGREIIDYNGVINPMASAIKQAWAVTTVSNSYLQELHENSLGLEPLFNKEWKKQSGIINGIDAQVWNPKTDPMLPVKLTDNVGQFKWENKKELLSNFQLNADLPLFAFIGRLVGEKGADLLPEVLRRYIHSGGRMAFLMLGSGDSHTENEFKQLKYQYPGLIDCYIGYNESLSHLIYAGADFLIMPSRVEPCGLNQLYSMRYGTIPIVHAVGGLKDTVSDLDNPNGRGICFHNLSAGEISNAIHRAAHVWYNNPDSIRYIRDRIMAIDFSWESAIGNYFSIYRRFARIDA